MKKNLIVLSSVYDSCIAMLEHSFGHMVHVQYKAWDALRLTVVADWNDLAF